MELWTVETETRHGVDVKIFSTKVEAKQSIEKYIDDLLNQYPSSKKGCPDYSGGKNWSDALNHITPGIYIDLNSHKIEEKVNLIDAMALWEAFLSDSSKFEQFRGNNGACACRDSVAALVPKCMEAYAIARSRGFDDSFDWEFCPWFLVNCVRAYDMCIEEDFINITLESFNA